MICTNALLDSGAAGNFISAEFAQQHNLKLTPCDSRIVEALGGRPLGGGRIAHLTEEIHMQIGALHHENIRFTSAPILHHLNPSIPFVVEVDASNTSIGAVLSQRQGDTAKMFPCAFYSRKLSSAERNYDVGNRELLGVTG